MTERASEALIKLLRTHPRAGGVVNSAPVWGESAGQLSCVLFARSAMTLSLVDGPGGPGIVSGVLWPEN